MLGSSLHKGRYEEGFLAFAYLVELEVYIYLGKLDIELVSVAIIVVRLANLKGVFSSIVGKSINSRLRGTRSLA